MVKLRLRRMGAKKRPSYRIVAADSRSPRDGDFIEVVGFYEVSGDLTEGGTKSRLAGWADGWELWVRRDLRRRGVATWLLGHAADRLRSGGARRVLDYAIAAPEADVEPGVLPFLLARGYRELSRTRRGWRLP